MEYINGVTAMQEMTSHFQIMSGWWNSNFNDIHSSKFQLRCIQLLPTGSCIPGCVHWCSFNRKVCKASSVKAYSPRKILIWIVSQRHFFRRGSTVYRTRYIKAMSIMPLYLYHDYVFAPVHSVHGNFQWRIFSAVETWGLAGFLHCYIYIR